MIVLNGRLKKVNIESETSKTEIREICKKYKISRKFRDFSGKWYTVIGYLKQNRDFPFIIQDKSGKQYKANAGILYQYSKFTKEVF